MKKVKSLVGYLPRSGMSVAEATKVFPKRLIGAYKFIGSNPVKVRVTIEEVA